MGRLAGVRILVCDDQEDFRDLASFVLNREGCLIRCLESADAALAALHSEIPDILISDVSMPVHDGLWLVQQIRGDAVAEIQQLPAIAVSAHFDLASRREWQHAGFNAFLRKPLAPEELVRAVAMLVGRSVIGLADPAADQRTPVEAFVNRSRRRTP